MAIWQVWIEKINWFLTLYTLTSECIISILCSIYSLRCWQGEFVWQSRALPFIDHFLYSWCVIQGWYCKEILDTSHSQGLNGWRQTWMLQIVNCKFEIVPNLLPKPWFCSSCNSFLLIDNAMELDQGHFVEVSNSAQGILFSWHHQSSLLFFISCFLLINTLHQITCWL